MPEQNMEIEMRFIKLLLSSTLKTLDQLHPDTDVQGSVREHMLLICAGVRQRALDTVGEGPSADEATAHVDALIETINEYFDYAASPLFPPVELVRR